MKTAYIFLAEGFEEVEALTVVDYLRRAEIDAVMVSIYQSLLVKSSHDVLVQADTTIFEEDFKDADLLFLPGGQPGVNNLSECEQLIELLKKHNSEGKLIAGICAAPMLLSKIGVLEGKVATCYPGCERDWKSGTYIRKDLVVSKNIITSKSPFTAVNIALQLIETLTDKDTEIKIYKGINP